LSGDSLCEIAFVVERGSQFYLGAMSDALGHIRIVLVVLFLLFFASVFGGFSFGRVLSF
jgi:Na+/H+-translocating membrane pyrophosphatase